MESNKGFTLLSSRTQSSSGMARPVFVGNFEHETRQSDLERLFSKYGKLERVDMKSGFAFVYFEDDRDAADAVRGLDNIPFGYDRRRLSVEWARGERGRHRDGPRSTANQRPTKTLFVINFDPIHTRVEDIKRHFERYGEVLHVRIRRNFAFVQFETQEDATKALECTHMTKILDRVVSVEYALRDDSERGDRYDSPRRGSYNGRSPSPVYRRRPSPDYVRARSPVYDKYNGPVYDRRQSPDYVRLQFEDREHEESEEASCLVLSFCVPFPCVIAIDLLCGEGILAFAFSSQVSASCIIPGLSLTIRVQNSVSLSTPSPSRSPSLTIASASSFVIPSIPRLAEFLRRLSDVINPFSGSARRRKPPHNSDTKASASSFSAITGNKS
ncbi:hypothetical protein NC651_006640 [Populus alba x Populus x berolinensis]|nr:hypothetical protein NC651_006640 [Populus alba x Populus x berolinensis]